MGFFDSVLKGTKSFFGLGASGSGGTRDSFQQFEKYVTSIEPAIDRAYAEIESRRNKYIDQLTGPSANLQSAFGGLGSEFGNLSPAAFGASLRSGAATSYGIEQREALRAARGASGRGGMAFGGGGAALTALISQGASGRLAEAVAGSRTAEQQFAFQRAGALDQFGLARAGALDQFSLGRAGLQTQAIATQSQLEEALLQRLAEVSLRRVDVRSGLAGTALGGGLAGDQARQQRKTSLSVAGLRAAGDAFPL